MYRKLSDSWASLVGLSLSHLTHTHCASSAKRSLSALDLAVEKKGTDNECRQRLLLSKGVYSERGQHAENYDYSREKERRKANHDRTPPRLLLLALPHFLLFFFLGADAVLGVPLAAFLFVGVFLTSTCTRLGRNGSALAATQAWTISAKGSSEILTSSSSSVVCASSSYSMRASLERAKDILFCAFVVDETKEREISSRRSHGALPHALGAPQTTSLRTLTSLPLASKPCTIRSWRKDAKPVSFHAQERARKEKSRLTSTAFLT
jgi:hypothetical protein